MAVPHFPEASFPSSVWDGTSINKQNVFDYIDPDPRDYNRITAEIIAVQDHLNSLFSREAGDIIFLKNAVYDDLFIPVNSVKVPASNNPDWVAFKGGLVLGFGDQAVEGNEEIVYFSVQVPHNWKEGTDITPHVHWAVASTTIANVVWKLTYSWASINGTFPSETTIIKTGSADGTNSKHNISIFDTIAGSGKTLSSMLVCSLKRNSSNAADTLTGEDALLLEIDFHYQIDRFGSRYAGSH
jgi:hypothetical protein